MADERSFLTAKWRHLLMLNWAVPPAVLAESVPRGTTLDLHDGKAWVSLVAFMMLDTRVMGLKIPLHVDFEEVNLRFYVRRDVPDEERGEPLRRGVVFIRELVPRAAIAAVARWAYNERYRATKMGHALRRDGAVLGDDATLRTGDSVEFDWLAPAGKVALSGRIEGEATDQVHGSHGHFITEHYWGYAAQRDGGTVEYQVRHPPWQVHPVSQVEVNGPISSEYGDNFAQIFGEPPASAFLAVGSEVGVQPGGRI